MSYKEASMLKIYQYLIVSTLCVLNTSCTVFEMFLVPKHSVTIDIPTTVQPQQALKIFADVSEDFIKTQGETKKLTIQYKDDTAIVGNWNETNVIGYSTKGYLINEGKQLTFMVKGTNAYYTDLPFIDPATKKRDFVKKPMVYASDFIEKAIIEQFTYHDK